MLVPFFVLLVAAAVYGWLRATSLEGRAVRRWNEVQRGFMPSSAGPRDYAMYGVTRADHEQRATRT